MSENESSPWEDLLRGLLGPQASEEMIRAMRDYGFDPARVDPSVFPANPAQMSAIIADMQRLMATTSGPVNWSLAHDIARQKAWGEGDLQVTAAQGEQVRQALQVADLWLDAVSEINPGPGRRFAWRRSDWVDHTIDTWREMVEPVARNAARALSEALRQQMQGLQEEPVESLPPGIAQFTAQIGPMLEKLSASVFGAQVGQAVGVMSGEAFGSTDVGLTLGESGVTALVCPNVDAFADELDIPAAEVTQFLALRECAHARLFASVPWLRLEILAAVQRYGQQIRIDTEAIESAASQLDLSNMEALDQTQLTDIFRTEPSEEQTEALSQLETMLALIEGWVEVVTVTAARPYLPHVEALRETVRRRRIDGGPAEQMLQALVGLQMRPRRARDAAALWEMIGTEVGTAERDRLWTHPDLAPTAADLDDPRGFFLRRQEAADADADIDAALDQLIDGTLGWAEGLDPDQDSEGDQHHG